MRSGGRGQGPGQVTGVGWAGCAAGRGPWLAPPTTQYWLLCCVGGAQRDPSFSPISPTNRLCLRPTVQPVPAPSISPFLPSGTSRQPYLTEPLEDLCSAESSDRSLLRLSSVGIENTQLPRGLNVHTSFMLRPVLLPRGTNTPCRWDERQTALSFPALSRTLGPLPCPLYPILPSSKQPRFSFSPPCQGLSRSSDQLHSFSKPHPPPGQKSGPSHLHHTVCEPRSSEGRRPTRPPAS